MAKLVYNIEPASPSMISSLDRHCLTRVPDGSSNIVPDRSVQNRILEGDERGLMQSLRNLYERGVKKPAAQSEKPYLRIVLSASPEYFRPDDPGAVGTWNKDRLVAWQKACMKQLRKEHGEDLVFAELHLDEDTPHIHAVVAPTYAKKARKPGRQKRNETPEQFEARKAAALASEGVRTVGRASHPTLSKQDSFQRLRKRMTVALDHLGIEYGIDRSINAPEGQSTREWVIQEAARLREEKRQIELERRQLSDARANLEQTEAQLATGIGNLVVAIEMANDGRHEDELTAGDMAKQPGKFAVLKAAVTNGRPTRGFRARFWSLNNSSTGKSLSMPETIRDGLTKAFDRVAVWASEVRESKLEAKQALSEAREAAERIVASAEYAADQIIQEARQRAEKSASKDETIYSWATFVALMKEKIRLTFGEEGYRQLAEAVNETWETHPDNPNRPSPKAEPSQSTYSGPSGP